jgi:hypothetical protein
MQACDAKNLIMACLHPACKADFIDIFEGLASEVSLHGLRHIVHSCEGRACHAHCAPLVLLSVTAMPPAAAITHGQLLELLAEACKAFPSACVWQPLMQLPAAQQLMPADVLSKVVDGSCAEDTSRLECLNVGEVIGVLL